VKKPEKFLTESEAATLIGVTPAAMRFWRGGQGPEYRRVGRAIIYPEAGVLRFLASRKAARKAGK
jgi:hypothetical protein